MGLRIKNFNFNIMGVLLKNPIFRGGRGGSRKSNIQGGNYLKREAWTVCRFKVGGGGAWQKRGGVFEGRVDTPMHTIYIPPRIIAFHIPLIFAFYLHFSNLRFAMKFSIDHQRCQQSIMFYYHLYNWQCQYHSS